MDPAKMVKGMTEFFESHYKKQLLKRVTEGKQHLKISFQNLAQFSPDLAQELLDNPEETVKAAEIAISQMELTRDVGNFRVRFEDLPDSVAVMIRNIRSEHIGKLVMIKGLVRQKSDVRPQVVSTRYECPSCGAVTSILQLDSVFREPDKCSCGRRGRFKLISKDLVDVQSLTLEEAPEDLDGAEQPKRMKVFLKEDLVSPLSEKRTNPGSKVMISGMTKDIPHILPGGSKSTTFDLIFEANNFIPMEEDYTQITISDEEEAEIRDLARDPEVYERLRKSIAPSIYGHEHVKLALILQLFGGRHKDRDDGVKSRGDIHILLVGDPGAGKSQLLKRIKMVAPKSRYVSGKGASGVGLTASVVKDDFIKGYSLEAGALVLCNNGLCCIDEFDKMSDDDRATIHEALEQQTVSIAKANIQATLLARTTVLAAANPKYGRFDAYKPLAQQIELPPTLINRFDLIFPIRDIPEVQKDTDMARFILSLHQDGTQKLPEVNTELLKKYISYARQKVRPELTTDAVREIEEFYVSLRNKESSGREIRSVPITPRQLEGLVRLAEASARIQLRNKVTKVDAKRGVDLLMHCLERVGQDPETGRLDIDLITSGVSQSKRNKLREVQDIIDELAADGKTSIPIEEVIQKASSKHNLRSSDVEEIIETLKRHGEIFEPRRGFIQKL